jgi:hypothetical protein
MPTTNLQNSNDFNGQNFYVGLDVHKKSWAVTIRSLGMEVSHFIQSPGAESLSNYLKREFLKLRMSKLLLALVCGRPCTHIFLKYKAGP